MSGLRVKTCVCVQNIQMEQTKPCSGCRRIMMILACIVIITGRGLLWLCATY